MSELRILNVAIRRDDAGRYSLNDLHVAAGGEKRHGPGYWLSNQQTRDLVDELSVTGNPVSVQRGGSAQGTYVAEQLVVAYAAWISPRFHLQVLDTFLAVRRAPAAAADPMAVLSDPAVLRQLLLGYSERVQALQDQVHVQEPQVRALQTLAGADGAFNITEAAKLLKVAPRQLFAWLEQHQWIYRRAGSKNWLAYQPRLQSGVLTHRAAVVRRDDVERVHEQVLVTAKGLARLGELLSRDALGWVPADHLRAQQLRSVARAAH